MLTASFMIRALDTALAGYGQSVTLQRTAIDATDGSITVAEEVVCPAKFVSSIPQDLEAGGVQDIKVIVSPTGLGSFGVPQRDDRILIDGDPSNVEQIEEHTYGGQLVRVNLLCRG